jgi:hypothetical protein
MRQLRRGARRSSVSTTREAKVGDKDKPEDQDAPATESSELIEDLDAPDDASVRLKGGIIYIRNRD